MSFTRNIRKFYSLVCASALLLCFTGVGSADQTVETKPCNARARVILPPKPSKKVEEKLHLKVYLDDHFTPQEKIAVTLGIHEWVRATNGMITMEEASGWTADQDMHDLPKRDATGTVKCTRSVHIARVNSDFPVINEFEEESGGEILGLAHSDCFNKFFFMVMDRINNDYVTMTQTSMHEMGHILGLSHARIPYKTSMYPSDEKPAMCVTELDLAQLCDNKFFSCDPKSMWPCTSEAPTKKQN